MIVAENTVADLRATYAPPLSTEIFVATEPSQLIVCTAGLVAKPVIVTTAEAPVTGFPFVIGTVMIPDASATTDVGVASATD